MPIINKTKFYYIGDNEPVLRTSSTLPDFLNLNPTQYYWYVEFKLGLEHVGTILPDSVVESVRKNKIQLLLANSHEAFHRSVKEVYDQVVIKLNLPEESIILVSESADCLQEVKKIAAEYGKQEIKTMWVRQFEADLVIQTRLKPCTTKTLEYKKYEKKFLNFNRRWRLHRPLFVALLKAKNLLDKGYVSLGKSDDGHNWQTIWPMIEHYNNIPYNSSEPELYELLMANKESICSLPEMYLDTDDLTINQADQISRTDRFYNETYFSVVGETNFYTTIQGFENGRFFSEKTFKPIFNKHPFILITVPKSLELLRSLGYATFHPYINESYDNEPNDFKRMLMIIDEVERLCSLNDDELKEFLQKTDIICKYNYAKLEAKNFRTDCVINLNF